MRHRHPTLGRRRTGARAAAGCLRTLLLALGAVVGLGAAPSPGQELRVQVERAPRYLGEPFEVQVIATDFESDPTPEITPGEIDGGRLRFAGVSPSSSTSITIVNGQMKTVREVTFVYRYELVAQREGRIAIPEFTVSQGTTVRRTTRRDVEISSIPTRDDFGIEVELPDGPVFVGQKVTVAVEFRVDRETQKNLVSYRALVPLFDVPTLRFLDEAPARADTQLEIETRAGTLRLPATSREERVDGRAALVVRAERTMIALAAEEILAEAPTATISQGTRFRRDLFNRPQATSTARFQARGSPVRIEVAEVPREGRPASFAGAVGEGFSLEVSADRSVVQLGEPIQLRVDLRGDGDLSSASLPRLDAEGLFDSSRFRLPEDPPAGILDERGKHFEFTLRVLDASVREIPALEYAWFDARTRRFETTRSRPIALSVGAAEIVGADAVQSALTREGADLAFGDSDPSSAAAANVEDAVTLTSLALAGANLAVDRDPARLLRDDRARGTRGPVLIALHFVGLACAVFAVVDARRRRVDPQTTRRARAWRRARAEVESALARPPDEAVVALGRALRELVATLPEEAGPEFDALIAECDALRFAPRDETGDRPPLPSRLAEGARRFVADRSEITRSGSGDSR